jgi:hypothetical protein
MSLATIKYEPVKVKNIYNIKIENQYKSGARGAWRKAQRAWRRV